MKWMKMKAMESCWGPENMKLYTVEMKRAIAKCSNEDAPELSLPPFRSSYRFVNTMINQGSDMDMLKNMMAAMSMSMNQDNSEFSYVQPYSTNSGRSDSFMDKMKMMMMKMKMKDVMRSNYQDDYDMSEFFKSMQQYTMPSPWFGQKYEQILETCYEMATNLPREIADNSVVSGSFGTIKLGEIKMFTKCEMKSKMKLCMNQDIKNKVESNFGPMQSILQQTQLNEAEFFPLVMQLLHGEEIDYMTGSM